MGRTKKMGSSGRMGPRYGVRIRKRVAGMELKKRQAGRCPSCGAVEARRLSLGIWRCRRCGVKFAGGAYLP